MIVTVANLKGGVTKTTTAVILAEAAAERGGAVLLVDADPQGSASRWAATAKDDQDGLRSEVVSLGTVDLARRISAMADGYSTVVIDTPPGDLRIVQAAIAVADVVVVPCQPALMDLDRLSPTLALATEAGKPAAILLTKVRAGTLSASGAREALDAADLPVLTNVIPLREQIAAAYGSRPGWMAVALYSSVLDELEAALN